MFFVCVHTHTSSSFYIISLVCAKTGGGLMYRQVLLLCQLQEYLWYYSRIKVLKRRVEENFLWIRITSFQTFWNCLDLALRDVYFFFSSPSSF